MNARNDGRFSDALGWWGMLAACLFTLCMESAAAVAQSTERDVVERQVKAAYLYKFGSYVEWPERAFPQSDNTIKIGIIGAGPLADELTQMVAGRSINGRQMSVRKMKPGDSHAGLHILFIGSASNDRLAEILAAVKGSPVLTITEAEDGLSLGAMINFVIVDGKLRFEVAPRTAQQGNLSISARLLSAALKVAGGG